MLTVPERLPSSFTIRKELISRVTASVITAKNAIFDDGVQIRISDFDISRLGNLDANDDLAIPIATIDEVTQTSNRHALVVGQRSGGAIVFVIQSAADDSVLRYIFNTTARAANNQMSKTRGGLFVIGLHGIEAESLIEVAIHDANNEQPPTALRLKVSEFLSSKERDHVVGIGFISKSALIPEESGHVASSGAAYVFPRKESPLWHDDFAGLFSER